MCFCGQSQRSMKCSMVFFLTFICCHVRLASGMTLQDALNEVTGLSTTRLSTLVRPYVSSNWVLLETCASAHPSPVKYHSSTKLKDFSFPIVNWEGWGMMWSATILFSSKSFIFGCFFSCSFLSSSFSHSSSAWHLASSSSASLVSSSCSAMFAWICWFQALTSCTCIWFHAAVSCSTAWSLVICPLFDMTCLTVA